MEHRRFERRELKFVIDDGQRQALSAAVSARLAPDPHGDRRGVYPIVSLYYDSPHHDVYWDRERGVPSRRKLRVRVYGDERTRAEPASFVEIKHKYSGRVAKRRAPLPLDVALAVCRGEPPPEPLPGAAAVVVDETAAMVDQRQLRPAAAVRYARQAFTGTGDEDDLRVTFDTKLRYRLDELVPDPAAGPFEHDLLPPEVSIMEIKVNQSVPYWLTSLVAEHGAVLQGHSKYCRALEAAGVMPARPMRVSARWQVGPSGGLEAVWT